MINRLLINRLACLKISDYKSILITLIVVWSLCLNVRGQDPEFSQFYANPVYLNPAFTGTSALPRVVVNYRNQWPRQGNTFTTYNLTFDKFINSTTGGIGFKMMYDRQLNGVINSVSASFIYSEHFYVSDRIFFSMALETGFLYKQFNVNGLIFPGMIDQGTGEINGSYPLPVENGEKLVPDFSFGTVGQYDDYYFGFALHHLTEPDQSIVSSDHSGKLPLKFTVHAGAKSHQYDYGLFSKEFTVSPNVVYQQQGAFKQFNLGLYVSQKSLTLGLWYRNNISYRPNSMTAMVGYQNDRFQLGYSFDFSISNVAAYSYGSHEISMIFYLGQYHRRLYNTNIVIPQM